MTTLYLAQQTKLFWETLRAYLGLVSARWRYLFLFFFFVYCIS